MSTLLYSWGPVQRDEAVIRSTTNVIDNDAPSATETASPGFNELENDKSEAGGLTPNQLSSHIEPSQRYVPAIGNASEDLFTDVNKQVSSSGTAAQREAQGHWGHGTYLAVEGIEPTIVDGQQFKEEYFSAYRPLAPNGSSTDFMLPVIDDPSTNARMALLGRRRAQRARMASAYTAFYAAQVGDPS